jgi:HEAT repeat protein
VTGDDPDVVAAAAASLVQRHNETAARLLLEALRRGACPRSRIAAHIDSLSLPISHLLLPLLRDRLPALRFWAARLLDRYAADGNVIREVASLWRDPDPNVRKAAIETLAKTGERDSRLIAITALDLLRDPIWYVRAQAARALGNLHRVELCGRVAQLLADPEWWVRTAAKEALLSMGPETEKEIIPYLSSSDKSARNSAAEVLQKLGVVDRILAEAAGQSRDPEQLELIRKIMCAGGTPFVRETIGRAPPESRSDVLRVLQDAGVKVPD